MEVQQGKEAACGRECETVVRPATLDLKEVHDSKLQQRNDDGDDDMEVRFCLVFPFLAMRSCRFYVELERERELNAN